MRQINPLFNQTLFSNNSKIKNATDLQSSYKGNIYEDYQIYIKSRQIDYSNADDDKKVTIETDEHGYTIETTSKDNIILKQTVKRPDGSICTINDYKKGIISKQTTFLQNGDIAGVTTYNDKGIQIKNENMLTGEVVEYNDKGNILLKTSSGKIIQKNTYYPDGETPKYESKVSGSTYFIEKSYDKNGHILSEYSVYTTMNIINWIFDGNLLQHEGRLIQPDEKYGEKDIDSLLEKHNKTREEYNAYVDKMNKRCSYDTYKYDSKGRVVEQTTYGKDKTTLQLKITYEYLNNTVIKKEYDSQNQLISRIETTTTDTELGTHKEEKEYDADGNTLVITNMDIDKNGKQRNKISHYNDGTFESVTVEDTDRGYIESSIFRDGTKHIAHFEDKDGISYQTRFIIIKPDGTVELDESVEIGDY